MPLSNPFKNFLRNKDLIHQNNLHLFNAEIIATPLSKVPFAHQIRGQIGAYFGDLEDGFKGHRLQLTALILFASLGISACQQSPASQSNEGKLSKADHIELLNVSYDVSRDFYKIYNPEFVKSYQAKHPRETIHIDQSHGGSSKQALSVANGLAADVVTMNQASDIELLVDKGLVKPDWQQAFPNHAVPYSSTIVFLVRAGNPKHVQDWSDLTKPDIKVVMPNPKSSGTARYVFLAAYGYGLQHFNPHDKSEVNPDPNTQQSIKVAAEKDAMVNDDVNQFMRQWLANVVTFDNGSRAATTTFTQRGLGDVLLTTENEAHQIANHFAQGKVNVVYPSYSIQIDNPVAVVDKVTTKKGTTLAAQQYLGALWDKPAQQQMASLYLRPSDPQVLADNKDKFPNIALFEATTVFGPWKQIKQTFFTDGALFDQLSNRSKASDS